MSSVVSLPSTQEISPMLTGLSKKIELVANVAIIVVACLLGMVLVKSYLLHAPTDHLLRGKTLRQGKTLVLSPTKSSWIH